MGSAPILLLFVFGFTSILALTINETQNIQQPSNLTLNNQNSNDNLTNKNFRHGRHLQIIELPMAGRKAKRQIIRIPGDVSTVKLIRPAINIHPNRNQQFYRKSRRPNNKKIQTDEYDYDEEGSKIKRTLKKIRVNDGQEYYVDEEMDFGLKKPKNEQPILKPKRKVTKHVLNDYLANYEVNNHKETAKEVNSYENLYKGNEVFTGYDTSASSIHLKQVPAPNLFSMKVTNTPEVAKQLYHIEKPVVGKFYDENYIPGFSVKKLPTKGRQIQSLFSQQYTTHNPHVKTNFGLNGFGGINGVQYAPKTTFMDSTTYAFPITFGKFSQPTVAASDQIVTATPVLTPGIQVIQPPQFRDVTVSHPSQPSRLMSPSPQEETFSQRATIRDILEQDCPLHDTKGYCESPPRYPMQQIGNIVKKCATFMDIMNTQPFDEPHDVFGIAERSDNVSESDKNNTIETESNSSWARSFTEGSTACLSDLSLTEPGYAKEVISGRWFVIVQHPETTIQRISTDICRNPGKPCGGLGGLKCNKIPNKSTRCVQRFTNQRLISWDPESPDGCPRIRMFRFPSACICHMGI